MYPCLKGTGRVQGGLTWSGDRGSQKPLEVAVEVLGTEGARTRQDSKVVADCILEPGDREGLLSPDMVELPLECASK